MKKLHAYYLFSKTPVCNDCWSELDTTLSHLEQHDTPAGFLRAAYDFITTRYESGRILTILRLLELFSTSPQSLWHREGFMHCTNQNYLLAMLLVRSRLFIEPDIRLRWTLIGFYSPHQYLKVRVDDQWLDVDCWARQYGVGFGGHARGFNTTLRKSFVD